MSKSSNASKTVTDLSEKISKSSVPESSLCPFKLEWSIGINPNVPLLNLTTDNRSVIAYACSHTVILYDYLTKETVPLQGHQNEVATLSVSRDGKWMLTADYGEDGVVIVWDTETGVPVCTLFNPHGVHAVTAARISPNAKYLVTVGNETRQKVFFWLWTHGNDQPDATFKLTGMARERVKEISFNPERCEEFVLTCDYRVLFFTWKDDKLTRHAPQVFGKTRQYGVFNCSCFMVGSPRALTGTASGFVLVWQLMEQENGTQQFEHLKYIQLQKTSITVIMNHEGLVVTGNMAGRVTFYDPGLRILYWCQNPGLDGIRSISFNLRSKLLGPVPTAEQSDLEFGDYSDYEEGGEGIDYVWDEIPCGIDMPCSPRCTKSSTTMFDDPKICSTLTVNLEPASRATDATVENAPFTVSNFFVCTVTGVIALIEVCRLLCHFFLQDSASPITSLATHPSRCYVVTGDGRGVLRLYNYQDRSIIISRKSTPLPDFYPILAEQTENKEIAFVTRPESHASQTAITALKYSPKSEMLVGGLENGAVWMLHPLTLAPLEKYPYKHSTESILKVAFSKCAEYMAYSDNSLSVAVFKKNSQGKSSLWSFVGKYNAHYMAITDLLFGPPTSDSDTPRLFSLGEDRDLVEYDLKHSGPYPDPGLQVLETIGVEDTAIPLSLSWYPRSGLETFLLISNSDYKYRLVNDMIKTIRGTFLGPTFGAPVRQIETRRNGAKHYGIFMTDKEVGLQILPTDGNPYKSIGIIGHPRKIRQIAIDCEDDILFTCGWKDPCVLMWRIKYRSVDTMARLGGQGLSPYYCLLDGGRNGWFIREMQDLFYYAQILQQGENTTAARTVTDKLVIKQIPNLMRAVGFYPSNEELEFIIAEVSYRSYAETGQMTEEISFDDFVRLYINHRPVSGPSVADIKKAFDILTRPPHQECDFEESPTMSRHQFLDILMGRDTQKSRMKIPKVYGEPLTRQEALLFLTLLGSDEEDIEVKEDADITMTDFNFLPERISYKEFIADIMGIELPEGFEG